MSRTNEIFTWMAEGRLKQQIFRTYRLDEVPDAHRALEGRESAGKLLVIP
jgi:NADPH2:quinone reductase